jgi:hypothetical protein
MSDNNWSISAGKFATVPEGVYDAVVQSLEKSSTTYRGEEREFVRWHVVVDGFDDTVSGITSLSQGAKAKPAEWARRILGMSEDTDMAWGREARGKKEPVNWGPQELEGKRCQVRVENREDSEGNLRSNVVNVFAVGSFETTGDGDIEPPDFGDLPDDEDAA